MTIYFKNIAQMCLIQREEASGRLRLKIEMKCRKNKTARTANIQHPRI